MDYRDRIIVKIAEKECERINRRVVLALQKMTDGMQSGDDSGLKNIWDEVCVQVQEQEFFTWRLYEDLMWDLIADEVKKLDEVHKQSIWLQTDQSYCWDDEDDHKNRKETVPYSEQDIMNYILNSFILKTATDWKNRRIESYLNR
jgi:hypothetical protein